jgi:hypothetical protein
MQVSSTPVQKIAAVTTKRQSVNIRFPPDVAFIRAEIEQAGRSLSNGSRILAVCRP